MNKCIDVLFKVNLRSVARADVAVSMHHVDGGLSE